MNQPLETVKMVVPLGNRRIAYPRCTLTVLRRMRDPRTTLSAVAVADSSNIRAQGQLISFSPEMLAWIFHELLSRDHEDGCATWQPQGVGFEAYLNGTSQWPTPEDARKDGHIIRARCAPLSPASGFPVSWS